MVLRQSIAESNAHLSQLDQELKATQVHREKKKNSVFFSVHVRVIFTCFGCVVVGQFCGWRFGCVDQGEKRKIHAIGRNAVVAVGTTSGSIERAIVCWICWEATVGRTVRTTKFFFFNFRFFLVRFEAQAVAQFRHLAVAEKNASNAQKMAVESRNFFFIFSVVEIGL